MYPLVDRTWLDTQTVSYFLCGQEFVHGLFG